MSQTWQYSRTPVAGKRAWTWRKLGQVSDTAYGPFVFSRSCCCNNNKRNMHFTLYRRLRLLRLSAWWEHSWWRCCTGQILSSWTVSWPHPRARPPPLCRSLRRRRRWSGRAGCLMGAKWHHALRGIFSLACRSKFYGQNISLHLTCHQIVLQNELFDDVIGHQLGTVHNGIAGNIGHTT